MTNPDQTLLETFPPVTPEATLLWTAMVTVGDRVELGESHAGQRFMIPITGGEMIGAPGFENLSGRILPGGADRQLLRPDGVKELDAIYEMQTDDGAILSIRNQVITDDTRQPNRYAMSVLNVTAPAGPHDWLNRRVIIGTLQSARPKEPAVIIRAWLLAN